MRNLLRLALPALILASAASAAVVQRVPAGLRGARAVAAALHASPGIRSAAASFLSRPEATAADYLAAPKGLAVAELPLEETAPSFVNGLLEGPVPAEAAVLKLAEFSAAAQADESIPAGVRSELHAAALQAYATLPPGRRARIDASMKSLAAALSARAGDADVAPVVVGAAALQAAGMPSRLAPYRDFGPAYTKRHASSAMNHLARSTSIPTKKAILPRMLGLSALGVGKWVGAFGLMHALSTAGLAATLPGLFLYMLAAVAVFAAMMAIDRYGRAALLRMALRRGWEPSGMPEHVGAREHLKALQDPTVGKILWSLDVALRAIGLVAVAMGAHMIYMTLGLGAMAAAPLVPALAFLGLGAVLLAIPGLHKAIGLLFTGFGAYAGYTALGAAAAAFLPGLLLLGMGALMILVIPDRRIAALAKSRGWTPGMPPQAPEPVDEAAQEAPVIVKAPAPTTWEGALKGSYEDAPPPEDFALLVEALRAGPRPRHKRQLLQGLARQPWLDLARANPEVRALAEGLAESGEDALVRDDAKALVAAIDATESPAAPALDEEAAPAAPAPRSWERIIEAWYEEAPPAEDFAVLVEALKAGPRPRHKRQLLQGLARQPWLELARANPEVRALAEGLAKSGEDALVRGDAEALVAALSAPAEG